VAFIREGHRSEELQYSRPRTAMTDVINCQLERYMKGSDCDELTKETMKVVLAERK
jgi:hypothetical protein